MELKAQELNHKAEIIERKERRELAALLNRHLTIASCPEMFPFSVTVRKIIIIIYLQLIQPIYIFLDY